jgi:hypothetical protein
MSRELLRRLREATPDSNQNMDMYTLLLEVDRELAKPESQPVARVSEGLRLEWVCTHDMATALVGQKLYPRDGV